MTELSPIVVALAGLVSAVYSILNGNLAGVFTVVAPLMALQGVDFKKIGADIKALTPAEQAQLDAQFKSALSISNPVVLAKIAGAADALTATVDVAEQAYGVYVSAVGVVNQFKKLFA